MNRPNKSPHRQWLRFFVSLAMRYSATIAAALSIFTSGCTTTIVNQFHGEVSNIKLDNRTETVKCDIPGYCSGPSVHGDEFVGFGLPAQGFSFFLFYPKDASCQRFVTNTEPPSVDAWLVWTNGYFDWDRVLKSGDPEDLRSAGGKQLHGPVTVRWRNNSDFKIVVDLAASDGERTSLRGEFAGYTQMKFDPGAFVAGLAMVFFGDGRSTSPEPTNAPINNAEH